MRVNRELMFEAVVDERRKIARLLDDLDDAQLATPSLCAGWDVKTVAAHVVGTVIDDTSAFLRLALRRGRMARAIDELVRCRAELPATEIAASLHRCADREISPPLFGPLDPLADVLVHGGDIRIPARSALPASSAVVGVGDGLPDRSLAVWLRSTRLTPWGLVCALPILLGPGGKVRKFADQLPPG